MTVQNGGNTLRGCVPICHRVGVQDWPTREAAPARSPQPRCNMVIAPFPWGDGGVGSSQQWNPVGQLDAHIANESAVVRCHHPHHQTGTGRTRKTGHLGCYSTKRNKDCETICRLGITGPLLRAVSTCRLRGSKLDAFVQHASNAGSMTWCPSLNSACSFRGKWGRTGNGYYTNDPHGMLAWSRLGSPSSSDFRALLRYMKIHSFTPCCHCPRHDGCLHSKQAQPTGPHAL